MYTFKRMTSFILALLMLNLAVSCQKEEVNRTVSGSTESEIDKPVSPWLIRLAAAVVVYVVVELAEGQYERVTIINADGSQHITEKCSGIGSCAIPGIINNEGGQGDGEPLSSEEIGFEFESSQLIDAEYIRLDDGRIIFTINPANEGYENFFYSDEISISKPYLIDNPIFIEQMGLESGSEILVSGEYEVLTDDEGQKYIVIQ